MDIPYTVHPRPDTGLYNAKVGVWLFLASEVMVFGGLFSSYIFLRVGADYPWPVHDLDVTRGLINTIVLILSSVTVVMAWACIKLRKFGWYKINMAITVLCAGVFMVNKTRKTNRKTSRTATNSKISLRISRPNKTNRSQTNNIRPTNSRRRREQCRYCGELASANSSIEICRNRFSGSSEVARRLRRTGS